MPDFETPEAFIFIYEKEIFLSLKDGHIILYSINGDMLSNFDGKSVYSMEELNKDPTKKVYQLCLSDTRSKVLTVVKEKHLAQVDQDQILGEDFMESSQNKRQKVGEGDSDDLLKQLSNKCNTNKLNIKDNVHVNVIDVKKGELIAQIKPYDFKSPKPIRTQIKE